MKKRVLGKGFIVICLLAIVTLSWHTIICAADQALIEAARKEGKFALYAAMPIEQLTAFLGAFKKKYPFLDTSEHFRGNAYEVYSRLNVETGVQKYIADSVHLTLVPAFIEYKKKGWLMKYDSLAYKGFPEEVIEWGYWAPMRVMALIMAYNKTMLSEKQVPTTWSDLTDPKWKDQIGLEPAASGSMNIEYYTLKKTLGEGFWPKIVANKPKVYTSGGSVINALLRGEIKVAMISYDYMVYRFRELEGAPIEGIWPKEGAPISPGPLAIMANAPHPNAAKLFQDWALSEEGQIEMVKLVGAYSARSGVPPAKGNLQWGAFKKLFVDDWDMYNADRKNFEKVWESMTR